MPVTVSSLTRSHLGHRKFSTGVLTFDSSYATGGELLTLGAIAMSNIDYIDVNPFAGYTFRYDYTNNRVLAYRVAAFTPAFTGTVQATPRVIVEEVVAVSANTGTLANIPGYIMTVEVTAGSVTGAFTVIPTGVTPVTLQVDVNFADGVMTFLGTDAVTSVRVTYIPRTSQGLFAAANLVQETVVSAAGGVNLAARACLVQFVYNSTTPLQQVAVPVGEVPSSGEYALDINNSGATTITGEATQDGNTLTVRSVLFSGLPNILQFIEDADVTLTGTDPEQWKWNLGAEGNREGLVIPGFGCHLVGEETATNQFIPIVGPSGSVGENVAVWAPFLNLIQTQQTGTMTTLAISWLALPRFVWNEPSTPAGTINAQAEAALAEVANATNLATVAPRFFAVGR